MRQILFIINCTLFIAFASCNKKAYLFTSFHEPANEGLRMLYSYDGYKWDSLNKIFITPQVGNQKVMRDPSMVQAPNGTFHLIWTSSWRGDKGFGYASSKNLINWTKQKFISVMDKEPTTVNTWAPEFFYDDVQKQYIIIWASCIPGRFEKGQEADSNNHRMYLTTTKDFQNFSDTKLFFDPKFSVIDATIVKRANNDYILVLKDNTRPERNIKVAFGSSPLGPWQNISQPFTDKFSEGPTVVKVKDDWLIYFDSYQTKTYQAVSTKDFVTFKNIDKKIKIPEGHKHGTIVTVKKKLVKHLIKKTFST